MLAAYIKQNEFHSNLDSYVNRCGNTRIDRLAGLLSTKFALRRLAASISREYVDLELELPTPTVKATRILVPTYAGEDSEVSQMVSGLRPIQDELLGAYVHGSLATDERINYSDFDALVILKSSVLRNPARLTNVAAKLIGLRRIMTKCDPLQHHGWFVLTEADLRFYCDAYFPVELFHHSKSMLDNSVQGLSLFPRESLTELRAAFESIANSIIGKTRDSMAPETLFVLKSLLSQFMLLPALYIQARYGNAVFKKESFEIAKRDFSDESWAIMDLVSQVRAKWPASNIGFRSRILCHSPVLWHSRVARLASLPIPVEINAILTREFYDRMSELAQLMRDQGLV